MEFSRFHRKRTASTASASTSLVTGNIQLLMKTGENNKKLYMIKCNDVLLVSEKALKTSLDESQVKFGS